MSNPLTDQPDLRWRKASRSSANGSECVEVANLGSAVAVRDSKNPAGGALSFTAEEWRVFAGRVRSGKLG